MAGKDKETIGIVLLNLGGPDSLQAVKPFLYNLFSDREIIKFGPSFLQKPVAWLISSLRSKKTKEMYSLIGGKSPLLDITTAQAKALENALNAEVRKIRSLEDKKSQLPNLLTSQLLFKVYIGMRYWHPFINDTVEKILKDGIKHLIVLSLYPHYSKATTGSAVSEFKRAISQFSILGLRPELRPRVSQFSVNYIEYWYNFLPYIDALTELIAKGMAEFNGENVDVIYSAHSLPQTFVKEGDPYLEQIKGTITAVNSLLATRYSLHCRWHLSFQSRSGPVKWLQPTTNETIVKLSKRGIKNLFIVPISFVSDHIETLYEIDIFYRQLAMGHGINFKRCQSLNTTEKFIYALKELVMSNIK